MGLVGTRRLIGTYWDSLGDSTLYRDFWGLIETYWDLLRLVGTYCDLLGLTGTRRLIRTYWELIGDLLGTYWELIGTRQGFHQHLLQVIKDEMASAGIFFLIFLFLFRNFDSIFVFFPSGEKFLAKFLAKLLVF